MFTHLLRLGGARPMWETLFPGAELPAGRDSSFAGEHTGAGGSVERGAILQAPGSCTALPHHITG